MLKNTLTRFGLISRLLHWLIALGIIGLIWLGWWMVGLSYYDAWYHDSLELHKALGLVVLLLAFVKIGWRFGNPRPLPAEGMKPWERMASHAMHLVLFALMLVVPVTGYAITTSAGQGVSMFGLLEIPALLPKSDATRDLAIAVHYYFAYAGIALVLGHAGAALKHHLIDRDDTLRRMTWGRFSEE